METKESKSKTLKDLLKEISDLRAELFTLKFQNQTGALDQPHKIKAIRRDIARNFTQLAYLKKATKIKNDEAKNHLKKTKQSQKLITQPPKKSSKKSEQSKSKEEAS